jgi:hypothetical protein
MRHGGVAAEQRKWRSRDSGIAHLVPSAAPSSVDICWGSLAAKLRECKWPELCSDREDEDNYNCHTAFTLQPLSFRP